MADSVISKFPARSGPPPASQWPARLVSDLRTDHAGEAGAVMIYRGILATTRDASVRSFAQAHLATEAAHLATIEQLLAPRHRSRLLPLWRTAGWLTGALPAWVGPRAVFATIAAVETFVDHHYTEQIEAIDQLRLACRHPCRPCGRTCTRSGPMKSIIATMPPRAWPLWRRLRPRCCGCGSGPSARARAGR